VRESKNLAQESKDLVTLTNDPAQESKDLVTPTNDPAQGSKDLVTLTNDPAQESKDSVKPPKYFVRCANLLKSNDLEFI